MPATITTFHTMIGGTRAVSSQVNTNFSNYRGTIVPINTDTATASDLSHDIGTDEHRWRAGYFGSIDLETSTNLASLILQGQTGNTGGAFEFLIEGTTSTVISTAGIEGSFIASTSTSRSNGLNGGGGSALGITVAGANSTTSAPALTTTASGIAVGVDNTTIESVGGKLQVKEGNYASVSTPYVSNGDAYGTTGTLVTGGNDVLLVWTGNITPDPNMIDITIRRGGSGGTIVVSENIDTSDLHSFSYIDTGATGSHTYYCLIQFDDAGGAGGSGTLQAKVLR